MFNGAPKELQKAGKKAMASAGRKVATKLKRQIPQRWKKLIKSKAKMSRDGNFYADMGLYNGHEAQGHQPNWKKPGHPGNLRQMRLLPSVLVQVPLFVQFET